MQHIVESIFVIREYESIFETASVSQPGAQQYFFLPKNRGSKTLVSR
jgi:hypothetical protein